MTTSSEVVGSYQELKREVSQLSSDIYELSEEERIDETLRWVESDTDPRYLKRKRKEDILEELDELGMVQEEGEYRLTLLGSVYLENPRLGYQGPDKLGFSDQGSIEKSLWRMAMEVDAGSDRISSWMKEAIEELERMYNDLSNSYTVTGFSDIKRREEAVMYLEMAESAQAIDMEYPVSDEFIGEVNSGLENKTDLYVGRIRDGGSDPILPTYTGELVRVGKGVDNSLKVVRKKGVWSGILKGEVIESFEDSELEEFLYGINEVGN